MSNIKPIETYYNGYRFRSRLEARWAVFFDSGHIPYEYEPEGYRLQDGTLYLPDFYLPELSMHVEVKRDTADGIEEVKNKCANAITWGGPIQRILILSNIPEGKSPDGGIWHFPVIYWSAYGVVWGWFFFHDDWSTQERHVGGNISAASYPASNWYLFSDWAKQKRKVPKDSILAVSDYDLRRFRDPNWRSEIEEWLDKDVQESQNEVTFKAFRAARQARFEHGEKPNI